MLIADEATPEQAAAYTAVLLAPFGKIIRSLSAKTAPSSLSRSASVFLKPDRGCLRPPPFSWRNTADPTLPEPDCEQLPPLGLAPAPK